MSNLPLELLYIIGEYSSDLDVRRTLNVFKKLDMSLFTHLSSVCYLEYNRINDRDYLHRMKNIVELDAREEQYILDDHISMTIVSSKEYMLYQVFVCRLKKKTYEPVNRKKENEYTLFTGTLHDYYWEIIKYQFYRNEKERFCKKVHYYKSHKYYVMYG